MTFLYFAYGSNMLTERLKERCPSATPLGLAHADGYEVDFSKASKDGSGKGAINISEDSVAHGVLFEISDDECDHLDKMEGVGYGYKRENKFKVTTYKGNEVIARTYIPTNINLNLKSYDWYFALVIAGAIEHEMPSSYIDKLRTTITKPDSNPKRRTFLKAIGVLSLAGHGNWEKLIR